MTPACIAPQLKAIRYSTVSGTLVMMGTTGSGACEHCRRGIWPRRALTAVLRRSATTNKESRHTHAHTDTFDTTNSSFHLPRRGRRRRHAALESRKHLLYHCSIHTRGIAVFSAPIPCHPRPSPSHPPSLPPIAAHKPPSARPPCSCARGARTTTATNGRGRQRHTTTYGEKGRREDTTRRRPSPPGRGYGRERGAAGGDKKNRLPVPQLAAHTHTHTRILE